MLKIWYLEKLSFSNGVNSLIYIEKVKMEKPRKKKAYDESHVLQNAKISNVKQIK